jgi:hypothetical membrane protein
MIPRWALISAGAAPIALLATAVVARTLATADYNPVRQTLSVLAAAGRSEWVMTVGIGFSAACLVVTGLGLVMVRPAARFVLATGGLFGVGVALFPVTEAATVHLATTCISAFLLALWPAVAMTKEKHAPFIMRTPVALSASIALFVLLGWTVFETQGGSLLGIAERVTVLAELVWPAIVVAAVRFRRPAWIVVPDVSALIRSTIDIALRLYQAVTGMHQRRWNGPVVAGAEINESSGSVSGPAPTRGRQLHHPG